MKIKINQSDALRRIHTYEKCLLKIVKDINGNGIRTEYTYRLYTNKIRVDGFRTILKADIPWRNHNIEISKFV